MLGQYKHFAVLKYKFKQIVRQDKQQFLVKHHKSRSGFGNLDVYFVWIVVTSPPTGACKHPVFHNAAASFCFLVFSRSEEIELKLLCTLCKTTCSSGTAIQHFIFPFY